MSKDCARGLSCSSPGFAVQLSLQFSTTTLIRRQRCRNPVPCGRALPPDQEFYCKHDTENGAIVVLIEDDGLHMWCLAIPDCEDRPPLDNRPLDLCTSPTLDASDRFAKLLQGEEWIEFHRNVKALASPKLKGMLTARGVYWTQKQQQELCADFGVSGLLPLPLAFRIFLCTCMQWCTTKGCIIGTWRA